MVEFLSQLAGFFLKKRRIATKKQKKLKTLGVTPGVFLYIFVIEYIIMSRARVREKKLLKNFKKIKKSGEKCLTLYGKGGIVYKLSRDGRGKTKASQKFFKKL